MARRIAKHPDSGFEREIAHARRTSRIADTSAPRARQARYNPRTARIEVELADGWMFAFPATSAQGLQGAAAEQLTKVEIPGDGYALHWDELDVHFTVAGLLAGRLGSRDWMRDHARKAGSVTSAAKAAAARRNGRKGGRPPGIKTAKSKARRR